MTRKEKKEQNLMLPLNDFEQIKREFEIILMDLRDGVGLDRTTHDWNRKTYIFDDGKKSSKKYQTASEPFHTHGTGVDKNVKYNTVPKL